MDGPFAALTVKQPISFDVLGANAVGANVPTLSENHVVSANKLITYVVSTFATVGSNIRPTISVKCGGVDMAEKATRMFYNDGTYASWLTAFALDNAKASPSTGTKRS